ncbi:VanZ family protein [Filimonas effusa]|uniref:VanZ family protein n=1 Tax=Filimonas effusa TaxID=2508721 RepID=A0A4Q1D532_9BACT|nr:VanZ family protein [Filimonas effusa]RXK83458.1 VanZ family protein [Filimonas effusa]
MKQLLRNFLPAILFFILSVVLLTLPGNDLPATGFFNQIPYFDKWVHIGMFAILTYLFGAALYKSFNYNRRLLLLTVAAGIIYGVAMEFVQKYWTTGRSFDITDIIADTAGCVLAYLTLRIRFRKSLSQNPV